MPEFRRAGLSDMNSGRKGDKQVGSDITFSGNDGFALTPQEVREQIKKREREKFPDRIVEPRCNVCKHPYRDFIESMLVRGQSYKGISERVSPSVDRRSISHHYKHHMDLQDAALRTILEEEARLEGRNYEEGVRDAVTKRGVLETMLRKGFEDIQNGVTTVEARDLVQIAKLLSEMDSQAYQVGLDELRSQMQIFIQAIKDVCDRDTQASIAARVKVLRNREGIHKDIESQMDRPELEEGIPEAEVIEA